MFVNEENEVEYLHITEKTDFLITVKKVPQAGAEPVYFVYFNILSVGNQIRMGVYTSEEKAHNAIKNFIHAFTHGETTFTFKKEA